MGTLAPSFYTHTNSRIISKIYTPLALDIYTIGKMGNPSYLTLLCWKLTDACWRFQILGRFLFNIYGYKNFRNSLSIITISTLINPLFLTTISLIDILQV